MGTSWETLLDKLGTISGRLTSDQQEMIGTTVWLLGDWLNPSLGLLWDPFGLQWQLGNYLVITWWSLRHQFVDGRMQTNWSSLCYYLVFKEYLGTILPTLYLLCGPCFMICWWALGENFWIILGPHLVLVPVEGLISVPWAHDNFNSVSSQ